MPSDDPELRSRARSALRLTDQALEEICQLDFFIAGGPGGQHRNKTESGVRLTHGPTGVVVTATERRSQPQNRAMALVRLRERLFDLTRVPKPRKPTKVSRSQKLQRLEGKQHVGKKKELRKVRAKDW